MIESTGQQNKSLNDVPTSSIASKTNILFLGNPGVGKSTLLNCIMRSQDGNAKTFPSGISHSSGLTKKADILTIGNVNYIDTPGLQDVEMREIAADEITKGLKEDGNFQVVFVITLQSGKVRPIDIACIQTILDSANHQIYSFGVIINKMKKRVYEKVTKNSDDKENIIAQIKQGKALKVIPFCLKTYDSLEDEDDATLGLPELSQFLHDIPKLHIDPIKVNHIPNDDTMETLAKGYERDLHFSKSSINARTNVLFLGNPGVGKSTLLNCIMQSQDGNTRTFPSGISHSSGLTTEADIHTIEKVNYIDTPGLQDVGMRKIAAAKIAKGLKADGKFQVVFVITLQSGRVRPIDIACIQTILDSANGQIHSFGVIINKMKKRVYEKFSKNSDDKENIIAQIKQGKALKVIPFCLKTYDSLEDEDDATIGLPELSQFLHDIPKLHIDPSKVNHIPSDDTLERIAKKYDVVPHLVNKGSAETEMIWNPEKTATSNPTSFKATTLQKQEDNKLGDINKEETPLNCTSTPKKVKTELKLKLLERKTTDNLNPNFTEKRNNLKLEKNFNQKLNSAYTKSVTCSISENQDLEGEIVGTSKQELTANETRTPLDTKKHKTKEKKDCMLM